jgi:hypothetical protein
LPSDDNFVDAREQLLEQDIRPEKQHHNPSEFVQWGVQWQTIALMTALFLMGVAFTVGHHFYYKSLDRTAAGTITQQRWATTIGTGFSFLVVVLLRAVTVSAYQQYIWVLFKRKPLELGTLDKFFALTSDPVGFFSMLLMKEAKLAIVVALICW